MRIPVFGAPTTVVTLYGLAVVPAPLTSVWLTGAQGTYVPRRSVADPPWFAKSGANSVSPLATKVPQLPGMAPDGKTS